MDVLTDDDSCVRRGISLADVVTTGVSEVREAWESRRKTYTFEFLELDPCVVRFFTPSLYYFLFLLIDFY